MADNYLYPDSKNKLGQIFSKDPNNPYGKQEMRSWNPQRAQASQGFQSTKIKTPDYSGTGKQSGSYVEVPKQPLQPVGEYGSSGRGAQSPRFTYTNMGRGTKRVPIEQTTTLGTTNNPQPSLKTGTYQEAGLKELPETTIKTEMEKNPNLLSNLRNQQYLDDTNYSTPSTSNKVSLATSSRTPDLTNLYAQDNYKDGTVTFGGQSGGGTFSITGHRGKVLGSMGERMENFGDGKGSFSILGSPDSPDLTEQSASKIALHNAGMAALRAGYSYDLDQTRQALYGGAPTFYSPKPSTNPMNEPYKTSEDYSTGMSFDGVPRWKANAMIEQQKNLADKQLAIGQLANQAEANQINRDQNAVNLQIAKAKAAPGYSDLLGAERLMFDKQKFQTEEARLGQQNWETATLNAKKYVLDKKNSFQNRYLELGKMMQKALNADNASEEQVRGILQLARETPGMTQELLDALDPSNKKEEGN